MTHSAARRETTLAAIESRTFDLIVIGAGINGAGIARDAAMRGLRVLLLDKGDIGEGTTAWSTRLIHGGLRYLEYYEFPLVRESLRERELLFRNAPHLVRALPFLVPIYRSGKRGKWLIRMGMIGYDVLSFDRSVPSHEMLSARETVRRTPGINQDGLTGAAVYFDGQVEFPERISVENALSAADHGAAVLTYARVDELLTDGNRVTGVRFADVLNQSGQEYTAHAPLTVNVTGPWVDCLNSPLSRERLIGGTKGSHIIVERFPSAPDHAIYVENETDQRPYFIVPWNGLYLIGTTDTRYDGDLDRVVVTEGEIDYLIADTNRVLPDAGLERGHIRYTYAGVRPLPFIEEGAESGITRRHIVHDHAPETQGLISIIGGKLTTYRNLAEHATDLATRKLGRSTSGTRTRTVPFPGGNTEDFSRFAAEFRIWSELEPDTADRLVRIYGTQSRQIVERSRREPELLQPMPGASNTVKGEIPFAFEREQAQTLTDLLMRRTMLGFNADNAVDAVDEIARLTATCEGWDDARTDAEIASYFSYLERFRSSAAQQHASTRER